MTKRERVIYELRRQLEANNSVLRWADAILFKPAPKRTQPSQVQRKPKQASKRRP